VSVVVTLYTRPGCHLCDQAREAIEGLRGELPPFELSEIDIDEDERLLARYLERIPVVAVAGEVVSELEFDPRLLRASLDTVRR
jgi:glutaredoxin